MLKLLFKPSIRALMAGFDTPERKGIRGERVVHKALTSVLDEDEYRVLTDLVLPTADGTTQIDHVVLSRFGIFVIETKNMTGWIFGGADQPKWTQVHKRSKRRFQNPLRQNYAHVKAVQEILQIDQGVMHNFVVFTGEAEPKTPMPQSVAWGLQDLGRLIGSHKRQLLTKAQVRAYAGQLETRALENTRAVRKEHLRHLEKKAATRKAADALQPPACPKCSKTMVKRSNRKTGETFWGCAAFPGCKGTRKYASNSSQPQPDSRNS